jgi:hypothetical protein
LDQRNQGRCSRNARQAKSIGFVPAPLPPCGSGRKNVLPAAFDAFDKVIGRQGEAQMPGKIALFFEQSDAEVDPDSFSRSLEDSENTGIAQQPRRLVRFLVTTPAQHLHEPIRGVPEELWG